jgi:hypothetical protein
LTLEKSSKPNSITHHPNPLIQRASILRFNEPAESSRSRPVQTRKRFQRSSSLSRRPDPS